jgi:predicted HicB family RNase H-like nuclease
MLIVGGDFVPLSEAKKKSNAKHDKENFQYITFKARKGSRERIVEAAEATKQSTNGFIRSAVNKAVYEATGAPMEYVPDK